MISQAQADAILRHCRALLDAGTQLSRVGRARGGRAVTASRAWQGPHATVFRQRSEQESEDTADNATRLRWEADAWAQVWADVVNQENARRRAAAIESLIAARGADSDALVPEVVQVVAPSDTNRYAPTGRLETYE